MPEQAERRAPAPSTPPAPEGTQDIVAERVATAYRVYWRFNVRLILVLLGVGALVSFGVPLFAESLERIRFAGWSLPFYVGAQGATIVYLALVVIYIGVMTFADRRLRAVLRESQSEADGLAQR
ncbi:protein of unknown function [Pararobbsia alpina]